MLTSTKIKGKRITVMGLGVEGVGVARFFSQAGAAVTVTDTKQKKDLMPFLKQLKGLPIRYVLGKHRMRDFTKADLVVYSMGIRARYKRFTDSPYLAAALKHDVPLDTQIGLFFELAPREHIVGVTGTRGKSTTASLIAHILKQKYPDTVLAGNIRKSVLDVLPRIQNVHKRAQTCTNVHKNFSKVCDLCGLCSLCCFHQPVVLELSSWQLEILRQHKKSPHIAVVTSIFKDHLNRYASFHAYLEAKKNILRYQKRGDWAVLNDQVKQHREFAEPCGLARREWCSWRDVGLPYTAAWKLPGIHNRMNLAVALAVAKLYHVPQKKILNALKTFRGLEGRLQRVATKRGVTFYNDTTATAPDAVMAALRSFARPDRVILIAGGVDKDLDYKPLAQFLSAYPPRALVLLPGTATDKLNKALAYSSSDPPAGGESRSLPLHSSRQARTIICRASSMSAAVKTAWCVAQKGNTILLSPGAASFNLFKNEFERGEQFIKEVKKVTK